MPQKTLGALPCPIVYSVQISWLPHGSTFSRAHGRGVAKLNHAVAGPLLWVETGTNQIGWMSTNFSPMHIKLSTPRKLLWHYRVATHTIMPASKELPDDDHTTGGPCHA